MASVEAVVFDAYGTLLDVHGAMQRHAEDLPPDWERISAEWRLKQLEYSWVRSLTGPAHHADFWEVTQESLAFVAARHRITEPRVLAALLAAYRELPAYPDAVPMLKALRSAGIKTAILSNGEPGMLDDAVKAAGLAPLLDAVLSVEDVGVFKPDPRVYGIAASALGLSLTQMGFVSSNPWDAQAAGHAGFRVFWCNRGGNPVEYRLGETATIMRGAGRVAHAGGLTPAARIAASIELLSEVAQAPRRPADAVANGFFRDRRFIGSGDRRAVSERVWRVLRSHRRLAWWLERVGAGVTPRLLVAGSLVLEGWTAAGVGQSFSGGQYGPAPLLQPEVATVRALEGHTLNHPEMPVGVRIEAPDWVVPALEERFGAGLVGEMDAALEPAPLDLRVNLLKATREEALAALAAEGVEAAPTPLSPWGLRVDGRRPVTTGVAFQTGLVEIQDEGSQLVAGLVGAGPEMRVVDWCAGAGGKTLALAMVMENRGHLVACDVSAPRLEGAVRRLRRAGVQNSERHLVTAGDKWAKRRAGTFDRVLVDAPCTGTGTWRRNPDARMRLREQDLAELVVKQASILDAAARLVRVGGRLVYATCSVLRAENEGQVEAFLGRSGGFRVVAREDAWVGAAPGSYLALTPKRHGTDGFFGAVLERVEG